jgi:hypothetical protein
MPISSSFLSGILIDEYGHPPHSANFSVVTEGEFDGQHGFGRVQGDHRCEPDGTFTSPSLPPGRYYLRFFGILRAPGAEAHRRFKQHRVFDFIYPNAATVTDASPFEVQAGETVTADIHVPTPVWFNIAGKVHKNLLVQGRKVHVMFQRNMGILPDVGGTGFRVESDGSFEGMLLGGSYVASLHAMADSEPGGYTQSTKQFGSTVVRIEQDVLNLKLKML